MIARLLISLQRSPLVERGNAHHSAVLECEFHGLAKGKRFDGFWPRRSGKSHCGHENVRERQAFRR